MPILDEYMWAVCSASNSVVECKYAKSNGNLCTSFGLTILVLGTIKFVSKHWLNKSYLYCRKAIFTGNLFDSFSYELSRRITVATPSVSKLLAHRIFKKWNPCLIKKTYWISLREFHMPISFAVGSLFPCACSDAQIQNFSNFPRTKK